MTLVASPVAICTDKGRRWSRLLYYDEILWNSFERLQWFPKIVALHAIRQSGRMNPTEINANAVPDEVCLALAPIPLDLADTFCVRDTR